MSPIKDHTCLELVFDFPGGCTHWDRDLEHIKTKVMTHRSNHSCEIGVDASCYYEAAKTLLHILDLFYLTKRLRNPFMRITLTISPDKTDGVPYVKLVATSNLSNSSYKNIKRVTTITMIYSNADTIKNEDGIFVIKMAMSTPDLTFNKELVLGDSDTLMAEYVTPQSAAWDFLDPHADDGCWLSGPVLKYSENFPAPSVMVGRINRLFEDMVEKYHIWERELQEAANDVLQPATCVAGWTKLMTDEGEKEIRQLSGNIVRAWNGQVYSVVKVEEFNDDQPSVIVSFNNHKKLFVTQGHAFVLSNGDTRTASELQPGDCLAAWTNPNGTADVVTVTELQEGPVLGTVYHVQDPLQHKAMYDGIITVN